MLESARDVKSRFTLGYGTLDACAGTLSTQRADQRPAICLQYTTMYSIGITHRTERSSFGADIKEETHKLLTAAAVT